MNDYKCGDAVALAGYLYGECEPDEREAIDAHLAVCAVCAADVASLQNARRHLAAWSPPEIPLGFQMVSSASANPLSANTVLRPASWWRRPLPAWAQAAAAVLIFASGAALGLRAGAPPEPASSAAVSAPARTSGAVSAQDLAALEQRLRREMSELRAVSSRPAASPATASPDESQLLRKVEALLAESERRQDRELALRLAQVVQDFDSQRRVDLARIERTVGQIEGLSGVQAEDQRQMLNFLRRVSLRPQ